MRGSRFVSLVSVALLAAGCCATLSASPILVPSTFNFAGNVTFTPTTITFVNTDAATTPNQGTIGTTATGDYAGVLVNNGTVNIQPLNSATEPSTNPDASFTPPQPFISFIPSSLFSALDINLVFHGIDGSGGCSASPAMVGQTCTPPVPVGSSPINFQNNPGRTGPSSVASFSFSGVTADGLDSWTAIFSSTFTVPFQTVLGTLASTGSVAQTYAATVFVQPLGAPEPPASALLGLGLGLVGLAAVLRRRRTV